MFINKDGKLFFANQPLKQLYNVNPSIKLETYKDLLQHVTLYTLNGKKYPLENLPAMQALQKGKAQQGTFIAQRADGVRLTINVSAKPVHDEKGEIIAAIALIEDITKRVEAQQELKRSENKFRSLFEKSLDAILLTIPNGTILNTNKAAEHMFGMSEKEITKVGRDGIVVMDKVALQANEKRKREGQITAQLTFKRKDGSTFQGEVTSNLFKDADGSTKSSMIIRDITERKKAEEALFQSEQRFKLVAEAAKVFVYEVNLEKETLAVYRGEEVLGYKTGEIPTAMNWWFSQIHPDDRATAQQKARGAVETAKDTLIEYRIKRKQGDYIIVHDMAKMVKNEQGRVISIIGGLRDVTERRKAEMALKDTMDMLTNAIDGAPIPVILIAEDGQVMQINKKWTELTGYTSQDLPTYDAWLIKAISNKDAQGLRERNQQLFNGNKQSTAGDIKICTKNGNLRYWSYSASLAGTLDDGRRFIVSMAEDITEQKTLQEKLESYSKNLEQLVEERTKQLQDAERLATIGATAGMVGHDIRNPLQAISGELYLARQAIDEMPARNGAKTVLESVNAIQEQIKYINKIVSDLQDFERPLKPEYEYKNMDDLLVSVFDTVTVPDEINLKVHVEGEIIMQTDPTFIKRSLTNLVNNAIQAMPDGGELEVTAQKRGQSVFITVSDTGKGIPQEVKPNVFKPLMTTKSKGQGLGLAVVKRLIEGLNGKVSFESEVNKGTRFIVELPSTG